MQHERCPICQAVLPLAKTCGNEMCGKTFYRSEGGRSDALYCSRPCAQAQSSRTYRRRKKDS
jgi:hypothetical protein